MQDFPLCFILELLFEELKSLEESDLARHRSYYSVRKIPFFYGLRKEIQKNYFLPS